MFRRHLQARNTRWRKFESQCPVAMECIEPDSRADLAASGQVAGASFRPRAEASTDGACQ
jgi:hypothetical protein